MDNMLVELGKYGLTGLLIAVIVSFAYLLLRKQLETARESLELARRQMDSREADIKWYRDNAKADRDWYEASAAADRDATVKILAEQRRDLLATQEQYRVTFQKTAEDIVERLEGIDERLEDMKAQQRRDGEKK